MDGRTHALIGAAAADVVPLRVDGGVVRVVMGAEQCVGRHNLPGLAVPALGGTRFDPGFADGVGKVVIEPFDGDDVLAFECSRGEDTGLPWLAIHQHMAGTTLAHTAAEFGPEQPEVFTKHPQDAS